MKKLSILIIVFFLAASPFLTYSQWQQATGLDGANLTYMVSFDSVLMAVSENHGLYRKTTNTNWQPVISLDYYVVEKVMSAGKCVFALNDYFHSGIKKSFDGGLTWEEIPNITSPSTLGIVDTVLFFGSGRRLRSFDYGESYDTIQIPQADSNSFTTTLCDDSLLYVQHVSYYEGQNKLYYSEDYGNTWDTITTQGVLELGGVEIKKIFYLNGIFWAQLSYGTAPPFMAMLHPAVGEWTGINSFPYGTGCYDMINYFGKVLIGSRAHPVYYFNDSTQSVEEFAGHQKVVNQFLIHGDDLICATQQGASILDSTGSYSDYNSGLNHRNISSISSFNDKVVVTANNELYISDNGEIFNRIDNGYGFQVIATDSVFYTLSEHNLRLSRDEGSTWETYTNWLRCPSGSSFTHFSISDKYYFLGTMKGLFRTTPAMHSWLELVNGPFYPGFWVNRVESVGRSVIATEALFALSTYKSENFGIEFSDFRDYCILDRIDQTYYLLNDSIHYSIDQAQSWESVRVSHNSRVRCIDRKGDTIIVAGDDIYGNFIVEISYEQTGYWEWIDLKDNLPESHDDFLRIREVKIFDGRILVANPDYGLWYRDDILTSIPSKSRFENKAVVVYPNPANNNISFDYSLIESGETEINIYDLKGNQITRLTRNKFEGNNNIKVDLSQYKQGIYFYSLQTNNKVYNGKFLISK